MFAPFNQTSSEVSAPIGVRVPRLVDRLQQQQDRPLRHLVFQRRDAQRPLRAVRLRYVVPSYRRHDIPARLDERQQVSEIDLQVRFVVLRGHAVDAGRAILARQTKRLKHPFEVDQVMQRGQRPLGVLPRIQRAFSCFMEFFRTRGTHAPFYFFRSGSQRIPIVHQ